jgi:hypothetical protein
MAGAGTTLQNILENFSGFLSAQPADNSQVLVDFE